MMENIHIMDEHFHNYEIALKSAGYEPLTINSYVSAAHRFADYLDDGHIEKEREVKVLR